MKKYIVWVLVVLVLWSRDGKAQTTQSQDAQLLIYNVGFGVVSSGIGAVINKPKGAKFGPYMRNQLLQGLAGGGLLYTAKRLDYLIYKNSAPLYAWPSHVVKAAGYSMIENAAYGRKFFQSWNFELGPVRFDYNPEFSNTFRVRFLPSSILAIADANAVGGKFEPLTSLKLGQLVYTHTGLINNGGSDAEGVSFGRAIVYANFLGTQYHVLGHELIHTYQFQELQVLNAYTTPLTDKIKNKFIRSLFTNYIYCDVPYLWGIYPLAGNYDNAHHFQNFYEFEAEHFSLNKPLTR